MAGSNGKLFNLPVRQRKMIYLRANALLTINIPSCPATSRIPSGTRYQKNEDSEQAEDAEIMLRSAKGVGGYFRSFLLQDFTSKSSSKAGTVVRISLLPTSNVHSCSLGIRHVKVMLGEIGDILRTFLTDGNPPRRSEPESRSKEGLTTMTCAVPENRPFEGDPANQVDIQYPPLGRLLEMSGGAQKSLPVSFCVDGAFV